MADEVTTTAAQTAGEAGSSTNAAGAGGATATQNAGETAAEAKFSQADIDRIVKDRLAEEKKRADKTAEQKKLEEAGEYQKLLEAQKAEADELRAKLAARDHADLQRKVAADLKLPAALADRLRGDDEAALIADAKALLKDLPAPADPKAPANPANPAAARGGSLVTADGKLQAPGWGSGLFKS